ncbi:hypothetical protein [Spirosoma validum]|uniref:Tail fiber domain-containing protein n=1 Tax=Spirosoma validum TaxID=2771355 RepID=A0A927B0J4_9BACT|nr:hypothetical protein [Spirosoma validum]MBD2753193.1 hypothetical protein [Spirosoma validum]
MSNIINIQNRSELKDHFKDGSIPTGQDFARLIDAVLVKRDDRFFGVWQKGAGYQEGNIVLYTDQADPASDRPANSGIYIFVSKKQAEALAKAQGQECDCLEDDCCGNKPPGECCRWQLIHIDSNDHDWHVVPGSPATIMYAEVVGKLGVGTSAPDAFFHLNDDSQGAGSQLLFNPAGLTGGPHLQLKSGIQSQSQDDISPLYVDQTILLNDTATSVEWQTNVPLGYVFKKQMAAISEGTPTSETLLLLMGSARGQAPRVGINTATPQATLDVANGNTGIRLNVDDPNQPQLILLKPGVKNNVAQVIQSLDNQRAAWTTNTPGGFLFSTIAKKPLVVFDATGNVGIGTATPSAKLDIADEKGTNGRFAFDVESVNPMLTVTNLKDDGEEVNLNLSVEYDATVFDTDAKQGFEFRQEGNRVLSLTPDPNARKTTTFSTLVDGFARADGLYVRSLQGDVTPIESGLEFLKTLVPQARVPEGDNHTQMGFVFTGRTGRSSKIAKQFPDKNFGIAQHNLIALLVRSVQELSDQIDALQDEINGLKQGK